MIVQQKLNEITQLAGLVIKKWVGEGRELSEVQDSVLVIIQEFLDINNPQMSDVNECISWLKSELN